MKLGRTPLDGEIAAHLHLTIDEYNKIITNSLCTNMMSFEELIGEVTLKENEYGIPEALYETKELNSVLKEGINKLNDKEKLVISLYYKEEVKLKDIASILDISNSRASQIHSMALEKLGKCIKSYLNGKK
jgi:RNA polymerase sigma factor for flagellar operon FliA